MPGDVTLSKMNIRLSKLNVGKIEKLNVLVIQQVLEKLLISKPSVCHGIVLLVVVVQMMLFQLVVK